MLSGLMNNAAALLETGGVTLPLEPPGTGEGGIVVPSETVEAVAGAPVYITVISALLGLVCVALMIIILVQKKRASGIGAAIGGSSADTYYSKNKGKTVEGTLETYTRVLGAILLIAALVVNILI